MEPKFLILEGEIYGAITGFPVKTAYLTMIDDEINELVREFVGLTELTFIPPRPWSRNFKDIVKEAEKKPYPLLVQIEQVKLLYGDSKSRAIFKFLIQGDITLERLIDNYPPKSIQEYESDSLEIFKSKDEIYKEILEHRNRQELHTIIENLPTKTKDLSRRNIIYLRFLSNALFAALRKADMSQIPIKETLIQLGLNTELFLYPLTHRLRSQMWFVKKQQTTSKLFETYERVYNLPNSIIAAAPNPENRIAIPIMRYQTSSEGGLFYAEAKVGESHCGTFYFFEPESNIFLTCNNFLTATNKIHAYVLLGGSIDELINKGKNSEKFRLVPYDEIITASKGNKVTTEISYELDGIIDPIICKMARELEYDVILLIELFDFRQFITEILDARPRAESFSNIKRLIE